MMSVSYIISKYHKISIITITKYLQLVHKKPSFFAQKREIFQKKSIHQTCQGVDLNLDQFDLSAPERFAANVPSCSAALDSLEVQHIHFWWQDLEGQFFEDFLVDFGCICLELIFFQWKIVLEFAKRFCWNFHQIQDISQEISETVIQSQKWRRVFRGKWPLEVPKRQKLQTSQARVPLGLAFLQGSRKAAFKAEDQQLFANLYKDGFSGRVCVFFFPWKKQPWSGERNVWCLYSMFKNRSCKNTN